MNPAAPEEIPFRTWTEISSSALQANAEVVKRYCPNAEIIAVVKADGYGHGAVRVAQALESQVSHFAVANVTEATELRRGGIRHPILVLGPVLPGERAAMVAAKFIPTISTLEEIQSFAQLAADRRFALNLKIDTGMGRAGILLESANELLAVARSYPNVEIQQISTHLTSPDSDETFTRIQLEKFSAFAREQQQRFPETRFHSLNSGGILRFSSYEADLVRPGLMLYGASPIPEFQYELTPVCTWKAPICLIRELPADHGVSYGRRFITTKPMRTALLPVGYADGYPRSLSERGAEVLIHGHRCPVLGIITMDLIVVDVSRVPAAKIGDEAVLLGRQGEETISVQNLADKAGTIPWEILTGIQSRVKRVTV